MIITNTTPYTQDELLKLQEVFGSYVKTVIDIKKKVCSAGMDRHFEGEDILLKQGSQQNNIWGGGIDLETKIIDFNSFINIRPNDDNPSNDILNQHTRRQYEELTKFFFGLIYE